uniref:Uncharacterized protein n=1 Tax=Maylandia zebra TaxID=106582 RepID=A0A3P9D4L5_9CICH
MLHHYHWWKKSQITYPEVVRINTELLRVHNAQFWHQPSQCQFVVSHNGSIGGQVAKDLEVSLSPRLHNQKPEIKSFTFSFISQFCHYSFRLHAPVRLRLCAGRNRTQGADSRDRRELKKGFNLILKI